MALPPPQERSERGERGGGDTTQLLSQVLTAIGDLREEMRSEIHALRSKVDTMATKDDLKQFVPRETIEKMNENANDRMANMATRTERMDAQISDLRERLHANELAEMSAQREERRELDGRTIAIMTTVITLVLSPLVWALFGLLQHAVLH